MKNLNIRIRREAYIYPSHVTLCYTLVRRNNRIKYSFEELSKEVFVSLNEKEIKESFQKLENGKTKEYWTGFEVEIDVEKDKEKIKELHKKTMLTLKQILKELEAKEKEKGLNNWLWRDKIFRI